jgi:hypothetical protein
METAQGDSLVAIFISNQQKHHVSFLIFCGFYSTKSERVERGRWLGKGHKDEYGTNNVYTCI